MMTQSKSAPSCISASADGRGAACRNKRWPHTDESTHGGKTQIWTHTGCKLHSTVSYLYLICCSSYLHYNVRERVNVDYSLSQADMKIYICICSTALLSLRLSLETFTASWWLSCCSESSPTLKIELWRYQLPTTLLAEISSIFSLCIFSSSLQYLKVTIWCQSQSAALLWILTSGARHAQQAACDLKNSSKKLRKWCVQVIFVLRIRARRLSTGWQDFRETTRNRT